MDVVRVGADNLNDLMEHLKRFESGFDVYQIKLVGMDAACFRYALLGMTSQVEVLNPI
jgi:hypothetical protein